MFRTYAPSPVPGTVGPSQAPQNLPLALTSAAPSGGAVGPFKVREIIGVNFAFASPAMTDAPLWIRVDDPGSI